ncbi:MAG TPA: exosortase/archaeosortase family protein [Candidatus Thermoplasmatota archaeon]|nr:exosortase/archaeosortase family protein [Candidatus Thermoplasmatota archaeon]
MFRRQGAVVEQPPSARPERRLRPGPLALGGFLALCGGLLYLAPARWLWNAWMSDPYYSHGLLVALLAAGLAAWRLRKTQAPVAEPPAWGLLGVPAALGVYLWGFLEHSTYLMVWSAFFLLAALALATGGPTRVRTVAGPLLLGALILPTPWTLDFGLLLQDGATNVSASLLALTGVPLVVDLYTFHINDLAFEVTPACSGFQSAVSLLAIAAVIATVFPLTPRRRALVLGLAVPLALLLNIGRILAVVAIGLQWGAEAAEGFFHEWSSGLLFLVETLALLALAGSLRKPRTGGAPSE